MLVGHERQLGWLTRELPQVTLLLGPESVGKRVLAREVLVPRREVVLEYDELTAEAAREVERQSRAAPLSGRWKNFVIDNVDQASEQAQNTLLKTLEEPPVTARFILIAASRPLGTIVSRCARISCGLLTDDQVARVLRYRGVPEDVAFECAPEGAGQVAPALKAAQQAEELRRVRAAVIAAVKAAGSGEPGLLSQAMRSWEPAHTVQLRLLAAETVSGWRHRYGPSAVPGLTRDRALRLLVLLSRYSGARTGAAVALDEAFADGG